MNTLAQHDLIWCIRRMPKQVVELLKKRPNQLTVAGGFIRSCISQEHVNDIDIFATSPDVAKAAAMDLSLVHGHKVVTTDNAITVCLKPIPVQFIHRWTFASPEQVLPSFDFTIAKACIWYDGGKWASLADDAFYPDLAAKRLVYTSPEREEEPGGSLLRILKFYQRGYRIPLDSMGAVIARLVKGVDFTKLNEWPAGMWEKQLARVVTGLLREVDPDLDPEHIAHLPSLEGDSSAEG